MAKYGPPRASAGSLVTCRCHVATSSVVAVAASHRQSWARAHAAGLNIPPEPNPMTAEEQIEAVRDLLLAFCQEYYPEVSEAFENLTGG